jgi:hypothetical protein
MKIMANFSDRSRSQLLPVLLIAGLFLAAGVAELHAQQAARTSCEACHGDASTFEASQVKIVHDAARSIHGNLRISCHDCHGGNPDPALADDMDAAMDPSFARNPYRGIPARNQIPELCGGCHSSAAFMRRYNPAARIDQLAEYRTSHHGIGLSRGDLNVAVCTDCHGVHDILKVETPSSPVYPTKVAETCATCHSDAQKMAGYRTDRGRPLPVDQLAAWKLSVHARAMFEKNDLSAPTCNDCHGNHGATPPGVESVVFVCGACHGRETELFRASVKQPAFAAHNEYLQGGETCASCHEGMPQNVLVIDQFSECVTCHDNHAIIRPTALLFGDLPDTPCSFCHESAEAAKLAGRRKEQENYAARRQQLVAEADQKGLTGSARYTWLIARAVELPPHTTGEGEDRRLRPEFARLLEKFRLGDPTPAPATALRTCLDCHREPDGKGRRVAQVMIARMHELTSITAAADRLLLAAHHGGVEVRQVRDALDQAVESQIELETLVHTFDPDGAFAEKHAEGMEHARAALLSGKEALGQLSYRRAGLGIALIFIVLLLVALGAKIRHMSREDAG